MGEGRGRRGVRRVSRVHGKERSKKGKQGFVVGRGLRRVSRGSW